MGCEYIFTLGSLTQEPVVFDTAVSGKSNVGESSLL